MGLFSGIGDFFQGIGQGIGDFFAGTDMKGGPLSALFGDKGLLSNPTGAWDNFKNGRTNDVNKEIADENLGYQRERNDIEDTRYDEETVYNRMFQEDERDYQRAFAEEEREYQRALQQQIFEREDTAIERQVNSLSKLGINPLGQNLAGLGAGQALSPSSAGSAVGAPSMSARGGSALHNDFKMTDQGILGAIAPLMSLVSGVSDVFTGKISRDGMRAQQQGQILENQAKAIDNVIKANQNDVTINPDGTVSLNSNFQNKNQDFNKVEYIDKKASAERNERENVFQNTYGSHDNSSNYEQIATDMAHQVDRAGQYLGNVSENAVNALGSSAKKKIGDYFSELKEGWENDKRRFKNVWKDLFGHF